MRERRQAYDAAFKLRVVYEALARPPSKRIKPTCRDHPGIEPVRRALAEIPGDDPGSPIARVRCRF